MYSIKYYFYTKTKILGAGRLLLHPLQAVFFLVLVLTFQEYFDLFLDSLVSRIQQDSAGSVTLSAPHASSGEAKALQLVNSSTKVIPTISSELESVL